MKYNPKTLQRVEPEPCPPPTLDPWPNAQSNTHNTSEGAHALLRLMRASNPSPHTVWIDRPSTSISQVLSTEPNHRTFLGLSLFEGMHLGLGCFVFEERQSSQWWAELRDTGHPFYVNGERVSGAVRLEHGTELAFNEVVFRFEQHISPNLALESTMEFTDELVHDVLSIHDAPTPNPSHYEELVADEAHALGSAQTHDNIHQETPAKDEDVGS